MRAVSAIAGACGPADLACWYQEVDMRIMVTYASRHGATAGIAQRIADELSPRPTG